MKDEGISPDVYSYSILVNAFCKEGDIESEMEHCNKKPPLVCCSSVLMGLCMKGLVKDCLNFFHELSAKGYKHDLISYSTLIHGFLKGHNMKSANNLVQEMRKNGLVPDAVIYNSLFQ
uniref:Pentacotripeptide-repeat region of PRORP domain-containing protein n=1 Tax=Salix viminalis TaxID=40686 RepID=A0A6N2KT17_SALVM